MSLTITSISVAQTESVARILSTALQTGDVMVLSGELGAGKTCFVRGLAQGLGIDARLVRSPTFVLHHVYRSKTRVLHHIDCYRLQQETTNFVDLTDLTSTGIVVIEWGELIDLQSFSPTRIEIIGHKTDRKISLDEAAPALIVAAFLKAQKQLPMVASR